MLEKYPKEVKLVIKHFPLDMHKIAKPASAAVLAAYKQGKYWEFHNKVFESISNLSEEKLQEIAKGLGLDMIKFNQDIKDPAIQNSITKDIQDGLAVGVRGTPAIFVNGKQLQNRSLQGFQQMIEAELKKKK